MTKAQVTPSNDLHYDAIIIGGGAAGLMCAGTAAARGRKVLVLEHSNKVGKKILMSGGGRCNFTNMYVENDNFLCSNPHFCKSALSRYTQWDFIALISKYELAYHEKTKGQLFCDNKAKDILNILLAECETYGANILTDCEIKTLKHNAKSFTKTSSNNARYQLNTNKGSFQCESIVVATGGLSIPTMGATGYGHELAKQFGHKILPREAALVPFILEARSQTLAQELAGLSVDVAAECNNTTFNDPLLFTHKGLSGPAILQISNYWYQGDTLEINLLPNHDIKSLFTNWQAQSLKTELKNALGEFIPKRLASAWLNTTIHGDAIISKPVNQYSTKEIDAIHQRFHHWQFIPKGTEGYRTAEVTRGGIHTDGVSSKTFESKLQPGMYFVGEVLDVTGWLGGFNFQWAWASGYCAGEYV